MKASVLYKWLTYSAIAISILLCLFMLQAGLKGNFRSVDAFQAYIRGFGLFAPFVFVFIQAFQVVVPVLPGFIGCVAGALLFGSVCARGNFEVDIHWEKGELVKAVIRSGSGGMCSIRYKDSMVNFDTKAGKSYSLIYANSLFRILGN